MNVHDSERIAGLLDEAGYGLEGVLQDVRRLVGSVCAVSPSSLESADARGRAARRSRGTTAGRVPVLDPHGERPPAAEGRQPHQSRWSDASVAMANGGLQATSCAG